MNPFVEMTFPLYYVSSVFSFDIYLSISFAGGCLPLFLPSPNFIVYRD